MSTIVARRRCTRPGPGRHLLGGADVPERTCSVPGCDKPHHSRELCNTHYARWRKYGDPQRLTRPFSAGKACSVTGCEQPIEAHGWCSMHYQRWRRSGDLQGAVHLRTGPPRQPIEPRFWARIDKAGPVPKHHPDLGPCWVWTGNFDRNGYGRFTRHNGESPALAYRVAYELLVGPIPEGLQLDHLCFAPACVKVVADEHGPAHLEPVTHAENVRRAATHRAKYQGARS